MKEKLCNFLPRYSGLFMVAFGVAAALFPGLFTWVQGTLQNLILGFIIFCMGMSLQDDDVHRIIRQPKDIVIGFFAQYLIMPIAAFLICQIFKPHISVQIGIYLIIVILMVIDNHIRIGKLLPQSMRMVRKL